MIVLVLFFKKKTTYLCVKLREEHRLKNSENEIHTMQRYNYILMIMYLHMRRKSKKFELNGTKS